MFRELLGLGPSGLHVNELGVVGGEGRMTD